MELTPAHLPCPLFSHSDTARDTQPRAWVSSGDPNPHLDTPHQIPHTSPESRAVPRPPLPSVAAQEGAGEVLGADTGSVLRMLTPLGDPGHNDHQGLYISKPSNCLQWEFFETPATSRTKQLRVTLCFPGRRLQLLPPAGTRDH